MYEWFYNLIKILFFAVHRYLDKIVLSFHEKWADNSTDKSHFYPISNDFWLYEYHVYNLVWSQESLSKKNTDTQVMCASWYLWRGMQDHFKVILIKLGLYHNNLNWTFSFVLVCSYFAGLVDTDIIGQYWELSYTYYKILTRYF